MLAVKTCGLRTVAVVDAAIAAGATHLGFVHFPRSPRHLAPEDAAALIRHAGERARTVCVTVDADDALLERIVATGRPHMLQLHGRETPERVATVRERTGLPVIKAVAIRDADDLARARAYVGAADEMLFDAKAPHGAVLPGGNGVSFDWSLLDAWEGPFWLSGGLGPHNAAEAMRRARPTGIDLSSGIEKAPGVKDVEAIRALFAALAAAPTDRRERPRTGEPA